MKLASTISRYLLGLLFALFGSNGFLHFLKMPPPSSPQAEAFLGAAVTSHFMVVIFALEVVTGLLLLTNLFVPLALVVLAGILLNILAYHVTMDPAGMGPFFVASALWFVTALGYRNDFRGLFASKAVAV